MTSPFVKLSSGAIVNLTQIVQITPPGHLQMTSGNVLTLSQDDQAMLEATIFSEPEYAAPSPALPDAKGV